MDCNDCQLRDIPLEPAHWTYSGEGNMKIVFTYTGDRADLRGWLLRLDKAPKPSGNHEEKPEASEMTLAAELVRRQDSARFSSGVIGRLIGAQYILPQRLVRVARGFLAQLDQQAARQRPEFRRHAQIDPAQRVAVLMPNMLERGTVTVELKPKWGFLTQSSAAHPAKRRVCRYCMHQHLKHAPAQRSAFCPLDLFSSSHARIVRALDALARAPQNNLRVFVDGRLVNVDGALDTRLVPRWDALRDVLARILLREQFLVRLGRLQAALDPLDIEGVFPVYQRALAQGALREGCEPAIDDWLQAAQAFASDRKQQQHVDDKQAVLEFMLSTVLKDISAMVTVHGWPDCVSEDGRLPDYRIAMVDTEPKRLAKLPLYRDRYQAIVAAYLESHPDPATQTPCQE
ncbi:hypothetical protein IWW51_004638 [Coemansia sp. RSA 2702]|nr:hypothetical protein IWW54_005758 [Coemansia sp. RSA 2705]KAJ2311822.1 hypothetical protein IWW52_005026 [Coemansia sp. RSA 2704]KAJ2320405.1 hypothetical protein IWW51_004638 [Coemansia sp. RSA 2702]